MTSKWIDDLVDIYADGGEWDEMEVIFKRIDKLLKKAMLEVDSDSLSDEIRKELYED